MKNRESAGKAALLIGPVFAVVFGCWTTMAIAQTDEIQVYTARWRLRHLQSHLAQQLHAERQKTVGFSADLFQTIPITR